MENSDCRQTLQDPAIQFSGISLSAYIVTFRKTEGLADASIHFVNFFWAAVINFLNHDRSISASLSPTEKIQKLVQKHQNGGYEYFQKLV